MTGPTTNRTEQAARYSNGYENAEGQGYKDACKGLEADPWHVANEGNSLHARLYMRAYRAGAR
jgi:hypothetical protein